MVGVESGKSMLGEAAGKFGMAGKENNENKGFEQQDGDSGAAKEGVVLKNRAGESRSPYVSVLCFFATSSE